MAQTITICIADLDPEGEEGLPVQKLHIQPEVGRLMIEVLGPLGLPIGYVCLEVSQGQLVLDYSKPEDYPGDYTQRIVLRETVETLGSGSEAVPEVGVEEVAHADA